jgi:hypothetical protein
MRRCPYHSKYIWYPKLSLNWHLFYDCLIRMSLVLLFVFVLSVVLPTSLQILAIFYPYWAVSRVGPAHVSTMDALTWFTSSYPRLSVLSLTAFRLLNASSTIATFSFHTLMMISLLLVRYSVFCATISSPTLLVPRDFWRRWKWYYIPALLETLFRPLAPRCLSKSYRNNTLLLSYAAATWDAFKKEAIECQIK